MAHASHHHHTLRSRGSLLANIFTIVAVLALLLIVVGFFMDWFSFSTTKDESSADSKVEMTLTVNRDEMKRDGGQLKDKLVGLKDAAAVASKIETVEGKVESVDVATGELVVRPSGSDKLTTLKVDDETEFKLGDGKTSLSKLTKGDEVVVTYLKKEGVRRVKKISLLENKP